MTADSIGLNDDGSEAVMGTHQYTASGGSTLDELTCHATAAKEQRLERFKHGIARTLKAIRFAQFQAEEEW